MGFGQVRDGSKPARQKPMIYQWAHYKLFVIAMTYFTAYEVTRCFYNTACVTPVLADAILDGLQAVNPKIAAMVLSGSYIAQEAQRRGIPVIQEVFADRITEEGTLVPRTEVGAFIKDPQEALRPSSHDGYKGKVVTNGKTMILWLTPYVFMEIILKR